MNPLRTSEFGGRVFAMEPNATEIVKVGDVVRVRKGAYSGLLEVDYVDDMMVSGRIPYSSTYELGGTYEGSYRGRQSAWLEQIEKI